MIYALAFAIVFVIGVHATEGDPMPRYLVVPQYLVDALGPKLSSNESTGRTIAEQLARDDNGGTLLQKMSAGESLSAGEKASLPPLMRGFTWEDVATEVKTAAEKL